MIEKRKERQQYRERAQKARTDGIERSFSFLLHIVGDLLRSEGSPSIRFSFSLFFPPSPLSRSLSPCVSLGEFNFLPLQCLRSPLLSRSLTEAACHFQRVKHAYARVRSTWLAGFTCAQKRRDPTIGVPVERHLRPASWCLFDRTQGDGNVKEGGVDSVHLEKAAVRYVGGETATE